ncbi:XrtA/PEP-CTERM system histidine kinase PrsK [Massilia endophytica]|uniref:XrtA/PEP-CTERM system histidine kinase PrsK n=1 Tax=Massilia endophytica TaxID=2899220 RepID=UPI001E3EEB86|nr:XrtA/PEP-CTERM system histidine kinase PrsK [Massilia endophytica]UGQ48543.1 PEP-CTERM system histidine kinase PrsK [Massilia endophytica]
MSDAMTVAAVSHGVAALAFCGFGLLLLASRRARSHQRSLLAACGLTALWAIVPILSGRGLAEGDAAMLGDLLEAGRTAAWLVFLVLLLAPAGVPVKRFLLLAAALTAAQLALPELLNGPAPSVGEQGGGAPLSVQGVLGARLLLAVLGLALVEQLFRNTPPRERWGIKFACLGIGALFAYDFYLYSDALLFRRLQPDLWAARGLVNALCVPLLAISAGRNPTWKLGLALSRRMALRSAALMGCALYLLAMAAGGWYLRQSGGAWGPLMQMACLFGAGVLLIGVLFSGTARSALRVFVAKHFFQNRYDYREEWMRFTRALSTPGVNPGEQAIQAIAALTDSSGGALWLLREGESFQPAARWNMPVQTASEPAGSPFCALLRERQWIVDVAHHAEGLPQWLGGVPELWIVVPLSLHGELFGFVALSRPRVAVALNWELLDLLRIAGSQAASCLAHAELADKLAVARQFESFNRMTAFIVHDLKGLLAEQSLMLSNAERHHADPEFQQDMLATLAHSSDKMKRLLQKLNRERRAEQHAPAPLARLLETVAAGFAAARPRPVLHLERSGMAVMAHAQQLERVLSHLVQNAVDATPPEGSIHIVLEECGEEASITIRDTGAGMTPQFLRERLFRPFETSKAAGMGIGVYEAREYIRTLGGRIDVSSMVGQGTVFTVRLPLHREQAMAEQETR